MADTAVDDSQFRRALDGDQVVRLNCKERRRVGLTAERHLAGQFMNPGSDTLTRSSRIALVAGFAVALLSAPVLFNDVCRSNRMDNGILAAINSG